ncbi:hypothetical protein [Actinophytocola sp. NPDC049390]|uniref:hypothetical protein n=1 Tax=Actinophytocola sp. NPDC049390 TaxID=3363894 RepID=UPI003796E5F2
MTAHRQERAVEAHLFRDGIEIPTQFEASWDLSECPEPANYQFSHKVKPFGHRHGPTEIDPGSRVMERQRWLTS